MRQKLWPYRRELLHSSVQVDSVQEGGVQCTLLSCTKSTGTKEYGGKRFRKLLMMDGVVPSLLGKPPSSNQQLYINHDLMDVLVECDRGTE